MAVLWTALPWMARPALAAEPVRDRDRRPNILFLFGDDWAWPDASCLGTPGISTPTFDRLVREGVLFRNAHAVAPSCSPSRAGVLTGQWPWRLESGANLHGFLAAKFAVYPDLLEQGGYTVGKIGKGYGPGGLGDRKQNAAGPSYDSAANFFAARPAGRPFCLWFGSRNPHRNYPRDSGLAAKIDPAKVKVPPYLPDHEIVRRDIGDYFAAAQRFDSEAGAVIAELERLGELDDTLVVMSGDNGWPFPRSKTTCYDSGTHQPLVIRWGKRVAPGRVVEDMVSLADLAPTFLEAAGVAIPETMTARSLMKILLSDKQGQVDPARDHTLTGMETHNRCRGPDGDGYPMRSLITKEFHYIRNFHPERLPAGDPLDVVTAAGKRPWDRLNGFDDCDPSPTKELMVQQRAEPAIAPFYDRTFGKRPARELYDLRRDPYEMHNLAEDPAFADILRKLDERMVAELTAAGDPRLTGDPGVFTKEKRKQ